MGQGSQEMSLTPKKACSGLFATCKESGHILMLEEVPGMRSRSSAPFPRLVLDCDATAVAIYIERQGGGEFSTRVINKAIDQEAAGSMVARDEG